MALHLRLWNYTESGFAHVWSLILPVREYREEGGGAGTPLDRAADWKQTMTLQKTLKRRPCRVRHPARDAERMGGARAVSDTAGGLPVLALGKDPALPSKGDTSGFRRLPAAGAPPAGMGGKGPAGGGDRGLVSRFRNLFVRILKERDTEPRNE